MTTGDNSTIETADDGYSLAAAARKGFELMTAHGPEGWQEWADLSELDMGSSRLCVLGQAYGSFTRGAARLFLAAGLIEDEEAKTNDLARDYGFEAPYGSYLDGTACNILEELRQAWTALLSEAGEPA